MIVKITPEELGILKSAYRIVDRIAEKADGILSWRAADAWFAIRSIIDRIEPEEEG